LKNMIKKQNQRAEFGNTLAKPLSTEEWSVSPNNIFRPITQRSTSIL
jgi:hypothetical protein